MISICFVSDGDDSIMLSDTQADSFSYFSVAVVEFDGPVLWYYTGVWFIVAAGDVVWFYPLGSDHHEESWTLWSLA